MTFKRLFLLLTGLILWGVSSAETAPETFVETSLGTMPAEEKLVLTGEFAEAVRSVLGSRYPASAVSYWRQDGKTVWILQARGKHGPIHAGFMVENGRIIKSEVLSFKEKRGKFIQTPRFLRQFNGAGLKKNNQLDKRVDGYSGATISVNAMKKMARLALYLDSLVQPSNE
jgi:hypothetical protein